MIDGRVVAERVADVRRRISAAATRAARDPAEVTLCAVTKHHPAAVVPVLVEAGIRVIGENRAQELLAKDAELAPAHEEGEFSWHFLGRIQRNKIAKVAPIVDSWHSVDRLEVAEALAARAPGASVYVQVNVAHEPQKGGCAPDATRTLVGRSRDLGLSVAGLMTVPPAGADPRPWFAALRELAGSAEVEGLSMGMSGDFEVAVEEGATIVRLGTVLLGPRPG